MSSNAPDLWHWRKEPVVFAVPGHEECIDPRGFRVEELGAEAARVERGVGACRHWLTCRSCAGPNASLACGKGWIEGGRHAGAWRWPLSGRETPGRENRADVLLAGSPDRLQAERTGQLCIKELQGLALEVTRARMSGLGEPPVTYLPHARTPMAESLGGLRDDAASRRPLRWDCWLGLMLDSLAGDCWLGWIVRRSMRQTRLARERGDFAVGPPLLLL
jgi:hypothetical protein